MKPAPPDEVERLLSRLAENSLEVLPIALATLALSPRGELRTLATAVVARHVAAAIALLDAAPPEARALAAGGLACVRPDEAYPRLLQLLGDDAPEARAAALATVVAYGRGDAIDRVLAALADAEVTVRRAAAELLYRFPQPPLDRLRAAIEREQDEVVRTRLGVALEMAGGAR